MNQMFTVFERPGIQEQTTCEASQISEFRMRSDPLGEIREEDDFPSKRNETVSKCSGEMQFLCVCKKLMRKMASPCSQNMYTRPHCPQREKNTQSNTSE